MKKLFLICLLWGTAATLWAQNKVNRLEYWVDEDFANRLIVNDFSIDSIVNMGRLLPLPNVAFGLHTLYYRFQDDTRQWSVSNAHFFERREATAPSADSTAQKVYRLEYWVNEDFANRLTINSFRADSIVDIAQNLTLPNLSVGSIGVLYYRFQDSANRWSVPMAHFFEKRKIFARPNSCT